MVMPERSPQHHCGELGMLHWGAGSRCPQCSALGQGAPGRGQYFAVSQFWGKKVNAQMWRLTQGLLCEGVPGVQERWSQCSPCFSQGCSWPLGSSETSLLA